MSLSFCFHLVVCFSSALAGGCPSDTKKSYLATGPNFGDKLTEQGVAQAQYNLGIYYMEGLHILPDAAEAVKWLRKAAEQGFAKAQHQLGICYHLGFGVPRDENEALKWIRLALLNKDKSMDNSQQNEISSSPQDRQNAAQ